MEPTKISFVETYKVDCPHGCYAGAETSITRVKGGPIQSISTRCLGNNICGLAFGTDFAVCTLPRGHEGNHDDTVVKG